MNDRIAPELAVPASDSPQTFSPVTSVDIDQKLLSELFYEYVTVEEDFMRALLLDGETPLGRVFVNEPALEQTSSIPHSAPPLRGQGVSGAARALFDCTSFRSECARSGAEECVVWQQPASPRLRTRQRSHPYGRTPGHQPVLLPPQEAAYRAGL